MGESLSLTLSARLKQALVRQQAEFDSDCATTNLPLTSLIDDSTDPQVFRAAADLLADPRVDRRMLGARILREIKTNRAEAGRLVHEQIGRESDDDVLLWLVTIPRPTSGFSALFELAEWRVAGNRDVHIETALREHLEDDDPRVRRAVEDALKNPS